MTTHQLYRQPQVWSVWSIESRSARKNGLNWRSSLRNAFKMYGRSESSTVFWCWNCGCFGWLVSVERLTNLCGIKPNAFEMSWAVSLSVQFWAKLPCSLSTSSLFNTRNRPAVVFLFCVLFLDWPWKNQAEKTNSKGKCTNKLPFSAVHRTVASGQVLDLRPVTVGPDQPGNSRRTRTCIKVNWSYSHHFPWENCKLWCGVFRFCR